MHWPFHYYDNTFICIPIIYSIWHYRFTGFDNLFQSSTKSDVLEMEYSNLNNDTGNLI